MTEDRFRIKSFTAEEKLHKWLSEFLDACALIDEGVSVAVGEREGGGEELACRRGCDNCCRSQRDIPVYPHELIGIYWFCTEKLKQPTRGILRHRLENFGPSDPCPFIMDGVCIIHTVRPAGCRQFNVFGEPCGEGEDPFHTRRQDVMDPLRRYTRSAFRKVLSLYGVKKRKKRELDETVEKVINTQALRIHDCDWTRLAGRMKEFDERPGG